MRLSLVAIGCSLFALALAPSARADGPRRGVIELDRVIIVGAPQRPNAFYVLERVDGGSEVVDLRTSFTDEIVRDADRVD